MSTGEMLGPAIGGVIVAVAGPGYAFVLDALTFAASAFWLAMMRVPPVRERHEETGFVTDLVEGWQAFRSRTWVWAFVAYFAIANMFWGAYLALGPVVADRDLGGAAAWGAVMAAFVAPGRSPAPCSPCARSRRGRCSSAR
jgi:hypothetical protein